MKLSKKSLLAGFAVQLALPVIYLSTSYLSAGAEQISVVLLFPFVAGIQIGPMLLRPFAGLFSPNVTMNLAMIAALVGNFIVYAMAFHGWFLLREKLREHQNRTVSQ